jgi:hypothetical protein
MQINFRHLPVVALAIFTTLTACKKDASETDPASELTAQSDDQSRVSTQIDGVANDANIALESSSAFSGKMQNPPPGICDATVVFDTVSNPRTITITYNGSSCWGTFTRTGTVILSMPAGTHWKDAGATLTATYQSLKITRTIDNKSITINGSHSLTNQSGGLLINLPTLQSITHTINSTGMTITFDDNSQRLWQVARKRTFTYNNGVVVTETGNHTVGNNNQIAEWGVNRFGHAFTTSITQPLVVRQDCNFRLTSGEVKHEGIATATASFGLDVNGNPTSCPGTGNYYFKLVWTGIGGNTHSAILPY